MIDRFDRYPFLREFFELGRQDDRPPTVFREELTENTLLYRPVRITYDWGGRHTEESTRVHFVLKDGTVVKDAVRQGQFQEGNDTLVLLQENTEGEAVLEAWQRFGLDPGRLLYVVRTTESEEWNYNVPGNFRKRFCTADIFFLPADRDVCQIFAGAGERLAKLMQFRKEQTVTLSNGVQVTLQPVLPDWQNWLGVTYRPVYFQKGAVPVSEKDPYDYRVQVEYREFKGFGPDKAWLAIASWDAVVPDDCQQVTQWFASGETVQDVVQRAVSAMEETETVEEMPKNTLGAGRFSLR